MKKNSQSRGGIEALLLLDHDLVVHELHHRALRIVAPSRGRHRDCGGEIAVQVVDIEVTLGCHLGDALERLVGHLDRRFVRDAVGDVRR